MASGKACKVPEGLRTGQWCLGVPSSLALASNPVSVSRSMMSSEARRTALTRLRLGRARQEEGRPVEPPPLSGDPGGDDARVRLGAQEGSAGRWERPREPGEQGERLRLPMLRFRVRMYSFSSVDTPLSCAEPGLGGGGDEWLGMSVKG